MWTPEEDARFRHLEERVEDIQRTTGLTYAALAGIPPDGSGGILNDIRAHKEQAKERDKRIDLLERAAERKGGEEDRKRWERGVFNLLWGAAGAAIVEGVVHLITRA